MAITSWKMTSAAAVIFLLFACAHQIEATLFILGNACVLALNTVDSIAGDQLAGANLEKPLETVGQFCRLAARYSMGGVFLGDIVPQLRRLIRVAGSGDLSLEADGELAQLLRALSGRIEESGVLG